MTLKMDSFGLPLKDIWKWATVQSFLWQQEKKKKSKEKTTFFLKDGEKER